VLADGLECRPFDGDLGAICTTGNRFLHSYANIFAVL
jgi:hypothetical protein